MQLHLAPSWHACASLHILLPARERDTLQCLPRRLWQGRLEAEAARRAAERAAAAQRRAAAAAEVVRRQGRLAQFRAAMGWCARSGPLSPKPGLLAARLVQQLPDGRPI